MAGWIGGRRGLMKCYSSFLPGGDGGGGGGVLAGGLQGVRVVNLTREKASVLCASSAERNHLC